MVELVPQEKKKKSSILFRAEEFTSVSHFYWEFLLLMK